MTVSGIILAAGKSVRMGRLKLLLELQGKSLVRHVVENALASRLDEVLVVVGNDAARIRAEVESYPVRIVENPLFAEGQSTSLRAGMHELRPDAAAVIVLMADQPFVGPEVINAIIDLYNSERSPIVAPEYDGQIGAPVLFDKNLFGELVAVSGDKGGRDVVRNHREQVRVVKFDSALPAKDIDTWEEYLQVKQTMLKIVENILDALDNGKTIALATVVDVRGPSVIKPGAKLLAREDGTAISTLGDTTIDALIAGHCERQIREAIETDVVTCDIPGEGDDAAPRLQLDVYIEVMYGQPTILIVGAGHIGYHLAKLAKVLRYRIVVVDDRPDFANRERFPEADEIIVANIVETLSTIAIRPATYVVLVPSGHSATENALMQVINSPATYIGMIGSRSRAKTILADLAQAEIPREKIDRVYTPVGLRIGAQTPEEIALSILAEIVKVRQGGDSESSRDGAKEAKHV